MEKVFAVILCSFVVVSAFGQEAKRVDITNFEDELTWAYSGNTVVLSYVEYEPFFYPEIKPKEGEASLYVEYNNNGNGWSWAQINFPAGGVDATGMTELHMWIYVRPGSVPNADGNYQINLQSGDVNFGTQGTQTTGEWVKLVYPIDTLTSTTRISNISYFGGFISPGAADASGIIYIDDMYFYRPAGVQETETLLIYSFDEEDPDTLLAKGWQSTDDSVQAPILGQGEVQPSQGTNYMAFPLTSGWANVIQTSGALAAFNRWTEVQEIMIDARVEKAPSNWGPQTALIIQSEAGGWDQYAENSFSSAVDSWKTLVWKVNMAKHAPSLSQEGAWMNIWLSTNNDAANAGILVFYDNFRVVVPKTTPVSDWSLF